MCLLPLLADSAIVVDEVHSFDKKMFSALLGFLREFDVPVLCMTATMQSGRRAQLAECVAQVYGYDRQPTDLAALAGTPRYRVARAAAAGVEHLIRTAVAAGKRVLWVVNQVSRAQQGVAELGDLGVPVICYHSRFKLDDRVARHRETVSAIRAGQPSAVAVSTQVCEMSLDIDADVLITEECPITSLIQRMGRCRRGRDELEKWGPGEVFVYKPRDEEKVYSKDDLAGLDAFVGFLESLAAASQTELEAGLERFGPNVVDAARLNPFLSSGGYALGGVDTYRDIEAFNVPAVLACEVAGYGAARKAEQPGFIVPVPRKVNPRPDPRLPNWLYSADDHHYDPSTGFHDHPIR
jgi:CRISPR-associated endonuclease/helicase Cas3